MKKAWISLILFFAVLTGCGKAAVAATYQASENNGIVTTYYEMEDGTWRCNGASFRYRLELDGRMPNAESDSHYVVLTNDEGLPFDVVAESLYSSLAVEQAEDFVIVEMH